MSDIQRVQVELPDGTEFAVEFEYMTFPSNCGLGILSGYKSWIATGPISREFFPEKERIPDNIWQNVLEQISEEVLDLMDCYDHSMIIATDVTHNIYRYREEDEEQYLFYTLLDVLDHMGFKEIETFVNDNTDNTIGIFVFERYSE